MDEPIFDRALMRKRGSNAFAADINRDGHGMNDGASAIVDWQQGWDDGHALADSDQEVVG
jgi:hypothetical protein